MDIKEMLFDLCGCAGVSGYEEPAAEVAKKYLEKFGPVKSEILPTMPTIKLRVKIPQKDTSNASS